MKFESKIKLAACAIILVMSTVAALPMVVNNQVTTVMSQLRAAADVERLQMTLLEQLLNAETAQRGFVVTGNERFLEPYHTAINTIPATQEGLRKGMASPGEVARFAVIERAAAAKMHNVEQAIVLRREQGFAAAATFIATGTGKAQMDGLRHLIGEELAMYSHRRAELGNQLLATSNSAANASLVATITNILFLAGVLVAASRVLRQRDAAERKAQDAADQTQLTSERISLQNALLFRSAELMHSLELAETVDESAGVIASYLPRVLPKLSGSLYLYNNSRDILERKAGWGTTEHEPDIIEATDCWALRRGSPHQFGPNGGLACRHVPKVDTGRLCLPLVTQGDVIGCLTVAGDELLDAAEDQRAWIGQLAEQLGLALSNVRLRVSLRQQSIVDPLTQLYNRRYLDEVLKREMARASRNDAPLSVLILDLDHFKRINDTFGHEGGDAILRKVALTLREGIRACDVACRMGGEEMVVLLADCGQDNALMRAEALRLAIAAGDVLHDGKRIGATASIGVASYPQHGNNMQLLMHAADLALYEAKHEGRNCVRVAKEHSGTQVPPAAQDGAGI
ncbi:diguanylate cyclase [Massilia sp. Dwa41.01b]|uniref:diguanylate cyclase n=1 Tax=unclassified Massilia TaxID=2609279 RepID=UPI001600DB38|nr:MULTISPECIES: diguanylate cyclase [unclassified Massilia]QNA87461.1 diguanylate cyclase [Massilia sp. Dwa41.01b]QNA98367.1 diguanylate cyclase [Massilia sp. Se16.2.3]